MATPTPDELKAAKAEAEAATERAADLTQEAQRARAQAKALWKHYDDLVLIAEGQQTLLDI